MNNHHKSLELTIYLPGIEDPIVVKPERVIAMGALPGSGIPFVDIADEEGGEEFSRYAGLGLVTRMRLGPIPKIVDTSEKAGKIILPT